MKTERLFRRVATYYFRVKVPADVRAFVGKTEIIESLRTTDHREATRLARERSVEVDREFARLRGNDVLRELTVEQSRALAEEWATESLACDEQLVIESLDSNTSSEVVAEDERNLHYAEGELRRCLTVGDTAHIRPAVEAAMQRHGLLLERGSPAFNRLSYEFLKAGIRTIEKIRARNRGEIVETPVAPVVKIDVGEGTVTPRRVGNHTLADLKAYWIEQQAPAEKTIIEANSVVRRFTELHGDLAITDIAREHVLLFRDSLKDADKAPGTIKKLVSLLSAMFSAAYQDGRLNVTGNPADNVAVRGEGGKRKARRSFTVDDLNTIFASPVFSKNERPRAGGGEGAYWMPLLALFTGARQSEIAQLAPTDLKVSDGVTFLHFTDEGDGQKLKTGMKGRKRVPVHADLIHLGFIDYVKKMQDGNAERLFPQIKADRTGNIAGNWSKWWGRYLNQTVGIDDASKDFHSFRHTFKQFCREAGIPEDQHDALTGHHNMNVARLYGSSDGYPVKRLADAVGKLRYEGLTLPERPMQLGPSR